MRQFAVMREFDFAHQVQALEREDCHPKSDVHLTVEQSPVVSLVCHHQKLESESHLNESQHHLHRIQPTARFRKIVELGGEESEEPERKSHRDGESQHTDDGTQHGTAGSLHQHGTHDRSRTGERNQHQGKRHEESADITALVRLGIRFVHNPRRQYDFESTEERSGKNHENHEKEYIRHPVRAQPVDEVRTEQHGNDKPQRRVNRDDGEREEQRLRLCLRLVRVSVHEERNGHRNHREHARHHDCRQTCGESTPEEQPQRLVLLFLGRLVGRSLNIGLGCRLLAHLDIEFLVEHHALSLAAHLELQRTFNHGQGFRIRHFHFLSNDILFFERPHLYAEHLVHFLVRLVLGRFAQQFQSFACLLEMQHRRHGTSFGRVHGINMPRRFDLGFESQFILIVPQRLLGERPSCRITYLRRHRENTHDASQ